MRIDELKSVFHAWSAEELRAAEVDFFESYEDTGELGPDYEIVYHAAFTPADLSKAQIRLLLDHNGSVGFFVDTHGRVCRRLGLWKLGQPDTCLCCNELTELGVKGMRSLFEAIAAGKASITVRRLWRFPLSLKLLVPEPIRDEMSLGGCWTSRFYNLEIARDNSNREPFAETVPYKPW